MSFILDALRRAEAQRERGAVPGLHSQPALVPGADSVARRTTTWLVPVLGALSLVLLAALLVLWWRTREPVSMAATPPAVPPTTSALPAAMPVPAPAAAPPPVPEPAVVIPVRRPAAASAATPASKPRASLPASAATPVLLRGVAELPEPWRGIVSRLSIGGAVHSVNPAQSFMMISGQMVHEGDNVAAEVTVERIGPRAAVLRAGPHRVELAY